MERVLCRAMAATHEGREIWVVASKISRRRGPAPELILMDIELKGPRMKFTGWVMQAVLSH